MGGDILLPLPYTPKSGSFSGSKIIVPFLVVTDNFLNLMIAQQAIKKECSYLATNNVLIKNESRIERLVGSVVEALTPVADRRRDLSATLGFLTSMRRRALPYLRRRR